MLKNKLNIIREKINKINNFSGTVLVKEQGKTIYEEAFGYADISNKRENTIDTRYGIASGAKIFTAIAVCQLIDMGLLSFDSKLIDCLNIDFSNFDKNITIEQLLTHSSGIPDYFDEDTMTDFSDLWIDNPMYLLRKPDDFIPMLKKGKMMFSPGEKFHYNNGAFVVLGLVIEHQSKMNFADYITKNILEPSAMDSSGYFALDMLPGNTALGYIDNGNGTYKSNIYSIPAVGGPDGGIFVTADDMSKLWNCLLQNKLLSEGTTKKLLIPHIHVDNDAYYGYGLWIIKKDDEIYKYYLTGSDPGVCFRSEIYPKQKIEITVLTNKESGAHDICQKVELIIKS